MRTVLLATVLAGLLLCATARADVFGQFTLVSEGLTELDGLEADYAGPVISQPASFGFDMMIAELLINPAFTELDGTFEWLGANGNLFAFAEGFVTLDPEGGFASSSGSWTITGGTGVFDGVTGTGTFAALINIFTDETTVLVGGTLIPAPGAAALLMLAGLAGSRRRRR